MASSRAGEREAVHDVRQLTQSIASIAVAPHATSALLAGEPAPRAALDAALRAPLADLSLVRVKLWSPHGRIVYSDEPELIGSTYELDRRQRETLATAGVVAEVSELEEHENRFEQDEGRLLEVYTAVTGPDGQRFLFEAYYRVAAVDESAARIWLTFVPIVLGSLVAAEAVHLLLAWRLARRLRASQQDRERLLEQAIGASDAERRRIAANLHDGVVQDLVGLSYQLSAVAAQLEAGADAHTQTSGLRTASRVAGRGVQALRTLMVDIYPPNLDQRGLEPSLVDLLEPLGNQGIHTAVRVEGEHMLSSDARRAAYRTAQEAVRNAARHADPQSVSVSVVATDARMVTEVVDDGRGFDVRRPSDPEGTGGRASGRAHLGLALLRDLASSLGGQLLVQSAPGSGTVVRMAVPR